MNRHAAKIAGVFLVSGVSAAISIGPICRTLDCVNAAEGITQNRPSPVPTQSPVGPSVHTTAATTTSGTIVSISGVAESYST